MSDTPRTDAVYGGNEIDPHYGNMYQHACALERELAEARRERDLFSLAMTEEEKLRRAAERRAAESEADARRYRWLRENDWVTGTTGTVLDIFWHTQEYEHLLGGELDAAIDAALASEAGKVE